MATDVIFLEREKRLVARISNEIDHHAAKKIREAIDTKMFHVKPEIVELDFGSVRFMDSSGIALILGRCEVASAIGASVRLTGLSPALKKLVSLAGLERVKNLTVATD